MTITPAAEMGRHPDRPRAFNRQMHYQPIDRCFNMEFGYWDENYKLWPIFVENGRHQRSRKRIATSTLTASIPSVAMSG